MCEITNCSDPKEVYKQLLSMAQEAMEHSYCRYSRFAVGAALLASDGRVFCGCNVENATFGSTICAERTAVVKAVSEGCRDFQAIAVVCREAKDCWPCGLCRQVLGEFSRNLVVVVESSDGAIKTKILKELLPVLDNA